MELNKSGPDTSLRIPRDEKPPRDQAILAR